MIITAPNPITLRDHNKISIFLAGSIEMGAAINWQEDAIEVFGANFEIFNPRRENWDKSWEQNILDPCFYQQVVWELSALEAADFIVMYFDPSTKSPISLLELGLHARSGKLCVICPEGFYRKGNVDIVCELYNIPMFENFQEIKNYIYNYDF